MNLFKYIFHGSRPHFLKIFISKKIFFCQMAISAEYLSVVVSVFWVPYKLEISNLAVFSNLSKSYDYKCGSILWETYCDFYVT